MITCEYCHKTLKNRGGLNLHLLKNSECKRIRDERNVVVIEERKENNEFKCNYCDQILKSATNLQIHQTRNKACLIKQRQLQNPNEFKCTYCNRVLSSQRMLQVHQMKNNSCKDKQQMQRNSYDIRSNNIILKQSENYNLLYKTYEQSIKNYNDIYTLYEKVKDKNKELEQTILNLRCVIEVFNSEGEGDLRTKVKNLEEKVKEYESNFIEKRENSHCSACMERVKNVLYLPCSHVSACDICDKKLKQCPYCRTKIEKRIKAYL